METHFYCPVCGARLDERAPQQCTGCGRRHVRDPKVGVGVVVRDDAGRLLLVQRAHGRHAGQWSLPAGFLDAEEDPRSAAARECLEETGLRVEVGDLLALLPGDGTVSMFLSFAATVTGGELRGGDDASDARFFAPDALPELAFESTRQAVLG